MTSEVDNIGILLWFLLSTFGFFSSLSLLIIFFTLFDQDTHEDEDTREKRMARERYRRAVSGDKKDEVLAKQREYQRNY
jgi:uncharacterized membrane protein